MCGTISVYNATEPPLSRAQPPKHAEQWLAQGKVVWRETFRV